MRMNDLQALGFLAHQEIIRSGGDVGAHLTGLFQNASANNLDIPKGAVKYLTFVYQHIEKAGLVSQYADEDLNRFMHAGGDVMAAAFAQKFENKDWQWLGSRLSIMAGIVTVHRTKIAFMEPVKAKQMVPAAPLEVRVVGMPERVTESSVAYDAEGNIKSTRQTEKDALAWESEA